MPNEYGSNQVIDLRIIPVFSILFVLLLAGCGAPDSPAWSNPENVPNEIIEKAFEVRIRKHPGIAVHCLEIEGSNPPAPVMRALLQKQYKIVPGLDCTQVPGRELSYQSADKQPANLYSLSRFKRNNKSDWDVSWVEYLPETGGKSGMSKLLETNGQWQANDLLDSRQAWGQ